MKTKIFYMIMMCLLVIGCEPEQKQNPVSETIIEQNATVTADKPVEQPVAVEPESEPIDAPVSEPANEPNESVKFEIIMRVLTVDKQEYQIIDGIWPSVTMGYVTSDYPEILDETQLKIGMAWANFDEKLNGLKQQTKSVKEMEIKTMAVEGEPVYMQVGEKITGDKFFSYGKWYQAKDFNFNQAKRLLKILPQRIPEREFINLQITVVFSDFLKEGGSKEFSQMTAGITLMPNQPAVIGGPVKMDEFLGKTLLISGENEKTTQSLIVLTVKPAGSN